MSDHVIEIQRNGTDFVAVCACRRWSSKAYKTRVDADDAGDRHVVRGDEHNRVLASFNRGTTRLATELKWYEDQSENPMNSKEEREMWRLLAEEIRPRVQRPPDEEQQALF